jgi:protein ImuA
MLGCKADPALSGHALRFRPPESFLTSLLEDEREGAVDSAVGDVGSTPAGEVGVEDFPDPLACEGEGDACPRPPVGRIETPDGPAEPRSPSAQGCSLESNSPSETVSRLRRLLEDYQTARSQQAGAGVRAGDVYPTGWPELDAVLPGGGLRPGSLIECLCDWPGAGAVTLALRCAVRGLGGPHADVWRELVVVDGDGDFYPPAALTAGIDSARLVVVRPANPAEAFWAAEQCLRCRSVGAVVATMGRLDETQSRRLQLAAEAGGGLGLVIRSARSAGKSFATVRMVVEPAATRAGGRRRVQVTLARLREGMPVGPIVVELPDEALSGVVSALPAAGEALGVGNAGVAGFGGRLGEADWSGGAVVRQAAG